METTQIPEVRESQKDHILCFHFSAPSILSCLFCLVPRCTNHPERLGCARMFQLAWRRLHQCKWLNYFLINQMIIVCGSHETISWAGRGRLAKVLCLRVTRRLSFAGVGLLTLTPRSNLGRGRGRRQSVCGPGSALSLHLPSLSLQQQTGQRSHISLFLPAAQTSSLKPNTSAGPCLHRAKDALSGHANTQWPRVRPVCPLLPKKEPYLLRIPWRLTKSPVFTEFISKASSLVKVSHGVVYFC